jgi:uncharacterized protein (TIGR01777 family)
MRVIITGGSGLIGSTLAADLATNGHEVIILSRNPARVTGLPAGVRAMGWDGQTSSGWGDLADGAGAIVNLAGESVAGDSLLAMRWTTERKKNILESRAHAGAAVVEAVRDADHKPTVVIQASAVGYYGSRSSEQVTEEAEAGKDFLAEVCMAWEASTSPVEVMGVRRAVIRIGIVLSRKGGTLPRQMMLFRFFAGGPIGSGKQGYPWIHIDDVSRAIRFLIDTPHASGTFNLCAPNSLTNAGFGRALSKAMHRPYWLPAPAFTFRLAFGEVATILLDGQLAYPKRLLELGYTFRYPQAEAALDDLLR